MQNSITSAFLLPLLLILSSGSAFSQIATGIVEPPPNYDTMTPPSAGATYVDPVFGSTIQRVTNALAMTNNASGGNLTWIEDEYATMSAFNNDNSKFILIHESYFGLYNGAGTYLSDLPFEISASSEPRWSRKDLVTLYYHRGNQLKSYNIGTGNIAVVHTFSEYSSISGNGEMDISFDGDHLVYCGDNEFIFVYQISTNQKFAVFDVGSTVAGPTPFDSMYITPQNNVIVSWYASGTARRTGQELFDINMNFLRQVGHADGHKDVTTDTNGDEVLIWTNSDDPQPISNCNNGIVKIHLADAVQTCLAQLDWSLAVHISAPDGNGTVFVDTEAPANPEPGTAGWVAYTDEILQVKLDGSGVTRWAQHRSVSTGNYNWEPKLSTSRDGTRLLYASNFDLPAISGNPVQYADTYLLVLGTASSTSPAPAPVTPVPVAPAPVAPVTPTPVVPVSQTIVFAPLSNVVTGVAPVTILATASSGLPVSLVSTTTAVCSVSGTTAIIVAAGTCSITASQAGSANYAAAAPITQEFNVNVMVPGPAIAQGGIVPLSGSSPTIQPGAWASIFGSNLAGTTETWNGDFPISLGGVSVTINGKSAYLSYVSPTQINLQAPDDAAIGNVNVTITTAAGSATSTVTLASLAPSFALAETKHVSGIILRSNGSGAYGGGTYDILGPTGSSLGYQTVAATQGDLVELFGVGFGPTSLPVPAGQAFSGATPTTNTVTVSINGTTLAPLFAGMSAAGLYQINVAIPAGLGTGDLALVATVGSVQTQSGVMISLQ